jgi:hypothetical protein
MLAVRRGMRPSGMAALPGALAGHCELDVRR